MESAEVTPVDDVDLTVERLLAALDGMEPDPETDPAKALPVTLRDFMATNGYRPVVAKRGNPAIGTVCKILKENAGQKILTAIVDAVLVRLKRSATGEGFGLLVSAAGYGCQTYDAMISSQIQTLGVQAPKAPSLEKVRAYKSKTWIEITHDGVHVLDVRVGAVDCSDTGGLFPARPGYTFVGVQTTLFAHVAGQEYDSARWRVVADGLSFGAGLNFNPKWTESLRYGVLEPGTYVKEWLAFEIPDSPDGFVIIYRRHDPDNPEPLFQLRFSLCP
jgi:hypothetical protein